MATGKITKRSVEAVPLPARGKRERLWDDTLKGFGLMVTDRGARSYLVQYRVGGRGAPTRRVTIGKHGSPWTAERARDRAAELLEQVRRKIDPFEAAKTDAAAAKARKVEAAIAATAAKRLSFSTVADRFIDQYAKKEQPRSWRNTESVFRRDLKPAFSDKLITAISRAEVSEVLDAIGERKPGAALKAHAALSVCFNWVIDKHLLSASPMAGMKPPLRVPNRQRALSDEELRLVWLAAERLGWPFGPIVRLLILTGQRRDEVAELRWPELDLPRASWLLPAERSKNGVASLVPLSDAACGILHEIPAVRNDDRLVFTTTGTTPVSGFSKIKRRLDATMLDLMREEARGGGADDSAVEKIVLKPWRFHDLRRTFATGCQRLGIRLEVVEAALNHISGSRSGIVGVYQTYRFEDEKREAMGAWARHVGAVVADAPKVSNIVRLPRARQ